MRRLVFVIAVFAALPIGAAAAQSWEDLSTQTALAALDSAPLALTAPNVAVVRLLSRPDPSPASFLVNFVAAGPAQTGVPCFACVKGAQTTANVGLTSPYNYIATKEVAQYALTFTDITNTASCKLSWAIAAGAKVLDSFSYTVKAPSAGSSYVYGFNRNRPTYSGAAVLTGKVACGGATQTTKASLIFQ